MSNKTHLYILWTNDNPITAEKMVFMYTVNSLIHGWWEKVTLIIWGATAKLVSEDVKMQEKVKEALDAGVHITACKACADQLGVTEILEKSSAYGSFKKGRNAVNDIKWFKLAVQWTARGELFRYIHEIILFHI